MTKEQILERHDEIVEWVELYSTHPRRISCEKELEEVKKKLQDLEWWKKGSISLLNNKNSTRLMTVDDFQRIETTERNLGATDTGAKSIAIDHVEKSAFNYAAYALRNRGFNEAADEVIGLKSLTDQPFNPSKGDN